MKETFSVRNLPIQPIAPTSTKVNTGQQKKVDQKLSLTFGDVLAEGMVQFSAHAKQRMEQRGVQFAPEQLVKINKAIDKAAAKGAQDALLISQQTALIVNVRNKTVVTVVPEGDLQDHVFTKIDSAVIITK